MDCGKSASSEVRHTLGKEAWPTESAILRQQACSYPPGSSPTIECDDVSTGAVDARLACPAPLSVRLVESQSMSTIAWPASTRKSWPEEHPRPTARGGRRPGRRAGRPSRAAAKATAGCSCIVRAVILEPRCSSRSAGTPLRSSTPAERSGRWARRTAPIPGPRDGDACRTRPRDGTPPLVPSSAIALPRGGKPLGRPQLTLPQVAQITSVEMTCGCAGEQSR